jgi:hypothetical protein
MTIATKWAEYFENHSNENITNVVNDFCNIYATSYEEYMAMWEILSDAYLNEED